MPTNQNKNPLLFRETNTYQINATVSQVLNTLQQADIGMLTAQADLFSQMEELDAHIFSEITKRKMAVAQLDWSLMPPRNAMQTEKKAIAKLEDKLRDALDIDSLVFDMADAIGKGFSCIEINWQRDSEGFWMPTQFFFRPQRWFTTDMATRQEIRLRDYQTLDGVPLIPNGWLVHRHSVRSTGYPAAQGVYRQCALPYLIKNFGVKNWLRFCELYGVPMRALFTSESDELKKQELMNSLKNMGSNGVALLDGLQEDFKTVDITKGEGVGFQNLIEWCEKSISKAILGATLTSQADGKTSTNALGNVHNEVRHEYRDFDARQIAETLNSQLISAIVKFNSLTIRPRWVFDTNEGEDLALYADAIPKLVAIGMKISPEYLHEKLKIPMASDSENVLATQQAALSLDLPVPKFTPDQMVIEELADNVLEKLNSPIPEQSIFNAIKAAKDYDDLADRLAVLFVETDTAEFRTVLERATFAADCLGYAVNV
jgi:phage gp29-like protein